MDKMNLIQILEAFKSNKINLVQYQQLIVIRALTFHKPNFQHSKN